MACPVHSNSLSGSEVETQCTCNDGYPGPDGGPCTSSSGSSSSAPPPDAIPASSFVVTLAVSLPLTLSDFDDSKQSTFTAAMAVVSGVSIADVSIDNIESISTARRGLNISIPMRRLLAEGVRIDMSIKVADKTAADAMHAKLTVTAINTKLQESGLPAATILEAPKTIVNGEGESASSAEEDKYNIGGASSTSMLPAIIGAASGLAVLLGVAFFLCRWYSKKIEREIETNPSDLAPVELVVDTRLYPTEPAENFNMSSGSDLEVARQNIDFSCSALGSGGSAEVRPGTYRFHGQSTPTKVAYKIYHGGQDFGGRIRGKIEEELALGINLVHPNLIRIYGILEVPQVGLALVLELATGGSLRAVLDNETQILPWVLRVRWSKDIAAGMVELHSLLPRAIIHRDLKAANIVLDNVDPTLATAKITDFGVAIAKATIQSTISAGSVRTAGTLAWNAPETFEGKYSAKSDVFSCGVVFFEMITRELPYDGLSEPEITRKVIEKFNFSIAYLENRGVSAIEQEEEWLQTHPIHTRRPNLDQLQLDCPRALLDLTELCWADKAADRPTFKTCFHILEVLEQELVAAAPRTFATSNYLREYEKVVPIGQAYQVMAALENFLYTLVRVHYGSVTEEAKTCLDLFLQQLQELTIQHADGPQNTLLAKVGATAELLWTSNTTFAGMGDLDKELCSLLNQAIREDHAELASSTVAMARSLNALCVLAGGVKRGGSHEVTTSTLAIFPSGGITWRGTGFDDSLRSFFTEGKEYRVPGFLATSFSKNVAETFVFNNATAYGKPAVLWKVHVDPDGARDPAKLCKHVNYVRHTFVSGEEEYLFTAYSVFTIRKVTWSEDSSTTPHEIELDAALDNTECSQDLPLAPWY